MLFCLFHNSPAINVFEQREIDRNEGAAAHRGRDPQLYLQRNGREIQLRTWAQEICEAMRPLCEMMDKEVQQTAYSRSLMRQLERVRDPELTPSARMLREMHEQQESFFEFAQRKSREHFDYFTQQRLSNESIDLFQQEAARSWERQRAIETADDISFDEFLEAYFSQQ